MSDPACESCGHPADLRLNDKSRWCITCDLSARRLGYDNRPARLLKPMGKKPGLKGTTRFVRSVAAKNRAAARVVRDRLRAVRTTDDG